MRKKLQFGVMLLALAAFAALPGNVWAQKQHNDRPPQAQPHPAPSQPHPQNQNQYHPNANRPPANAYHPPNSNQGNNHPQNNFNPPNQPGNHAGGVNPNRGQQAGMVSPRPWVDTMRELTPQQRERVLQNSRAFQNLSPDKQNKIRQQFSQWDHMTPQQQASLRQKEQTWRKLTPEQQQHLKNEVWPKWQQMPWDRQQVMKQKLGILQHMPESARNERLNDPNFTRGMSDEEKSMLHDLSHTHVGAPEPPNE
jgi:Protein of unknown function (DUF3106)